MKHLLILLLTVLFNHFVCAQKLATIDLTFKAAYQQKLFNGQVLVANGNEILSVKSYGFANPQTKRPFTDSSSFQIASITKGFTAVSILVLAEKKQLSLDDPVCKFLPQFPYKNIKINHLLNHTAGLPNFWTTISADIDKSKTNGNQDLLNLIETKKHPLLFEAGDQWAYADIDYNLLAMIIEKVSEQKYDVFLEETFFKPLGMKNTKAQLILDNRLFTDKNLSIGCVIDTSTNELRNAMNLPANNYLHWVAKFYGDGDITSTAKDLLIWNQALQKGRILTKNTVVKMNEPIILNNGDTAKAWGSYMAISGAILQKNNTNIISAAGGLPGFNTKIFKHNDEEITVIILSNLSSNWFWNFNAFDFFK